MKKKWIALLSIALCGVASAKWIKISDYDGTTIYVDSGFRKSGSLVKIWEMRVFTKPQFTGSGEAYLTHKMQTEHDCSEDRMRIFEILLYSGQNGSGNVVASTSASERWKPYPPDSEAKFVQMAVCTR